MRLLTRFALVVASALVLAPPVAAGAARAPIAAPTANPDLSMTVTFNQPKSYETIWVYVDVHNTGTASASNVVVSHAGLPFMGSSSPCDGGEPANCWVGSVPAGDTRSYWFASRAPKSGTLTLTSIASSDQDDANEHDNTNRSSVAVEPGPFTDLVIYEEEAFPAVSPGVVSFRVSVRNEGSELAKFVRAVGRPYPFVTTSAVASQGACFPVSTQVGWDCNLGPLLPGARAEIVVLATLTQVTTTAFQSETRVEQGAAVISEVPESDLDNNAIFSSAYATVLGVDGSVIPPPPPLPPVPLPYVPWSGVPWQLIPNLPDIPEIPCRVLVVNRCFKW